MLALVMTLMPRASIALCSRCPAGGVELALHQRRREMQHGDVHALLLEPGRRLEPEQAAADDDRRAARLGREQHRLHVVEIAIGQHAGELVAGHRE